MSSTAKVWREVIHDATVTGYVTKTLKASMYRDKTVDQSRQLHDVTSNYFVLIGCISCKLGRH